MSIMLSFAMWVFSVTIACWILKIGTAAIAALGTLILGFLGIRKEDGRQ